MLLTYFDYIFVHVRQKARLRPELSPKFLSTLGQTRPELGPNPTRKARSDLQLWFYGAKFISGEAKTCCLLLQYEHAGP